MEEPIPQSTFDTAYETNTARWVIGEPQPAFRTLEREGWIRGSILDAGCGAGEHTIHLTELGYDVLGIDFAPRAVQQARANAAQRQVAARFEEVDVFRLGAEPRFDTIIDSALFHVFNPADAAEYTRSLRMVCRPNAIVHVLALSDAEPGIGPRISDARIREAFTAGWELEDLRPSRYRAVVGAEDAARLNLPADEPADMLAWLARVRRI